MSNYFFTADIRNADVNTYKDACLRNCSCKTALFRSGLNSSTGDCYLPFEIFSLANNKKVRTRFDSKAFIKFSYSGRRRERETKEEEKDYLDHVPRMSTRFSYDDLKDFSIRFHGQWITRKWIYHGKQKEILDSIYRKKIIQDVAKGLAYLHEECRQNILHLDIKPPNIPLDEKLNAKLYDFGLAKLIDQNQSQVMTMMRGTPGYFALEWLSGVITEKVDVYSFDIVILKILSGRRHFEASETEEERITLNLLRKRQRKGRGRAQQIFK
ncbi:G-type lectin S-receptor-like serine/threonine-protein kinase [Capsicum baccatum]|uniref:non-specific serine/threonine protein kinase n=1 Tax=Capsicum baccatum TaxID=33114 RepID=A0A2G2WEG8_CAPBA|nr:G-type lectin S-receptor-like serine/threonine-protein kinase [Capsicum baccatum]